MSDGQSTHPPIPIPLVVAPAVPVQAVRELVAEILSNLSSDGGFEPGAERSWLRPRRGVTLRRRRSTGVGEELRVQIGYPDDFLGSVSARDLLTSWAESLSVAICEDEESSLRRRIAVTRSARVLCAAAFAAGARDVLTSARSSPRHDGRGRHSLFVDRRIVRLPEAAESMLNAFGGPYRRLIASPVSGVFAQPFLHRVRHDQIDAMEILRLIGHVPSEVVEQMRAAMR